MENFKFMQNKKCEYFPCHNIDDEKKFNCLFCYCPLYTLGKKCGGKYTYINDIKDCSSCTIPHVKNFGYEFIQKRILFTIK